MLLAAAIATTVPSTTAATLNVTVESVSQSFFGKLAVFRGTHVVGTVRLQEFSPSKRKEFIRDSLSFEFEHYLDKRVSCMQCHS
jgi:hypothetical protein